MSASLLRSPAGQRVPCYLVASILVLCSATVRGSGPATAAVPECDSGSVVAHVQEQFAIYGPRSRQHEYFGFIYRVDGVLASAVVRSSACRGPDDCMIETKGAANLIPRGAKVLGEWHTHPHNLGVGRLSMEDVRGAQHNAHIRCYTPYYAASNGKYYTWDPRSSSVPVAMGTRTELGSYWDAPRPGPSAFVATRGN